MEGRGGKGREGGLGRRRKGDMRGGDMSGQPSSINTLKY